MIAEDYVSIGTAKLLKEKGFNEYVTSFYGETGVEGYMMGMKKTSNSKLEECFYARPTLQMAMKWLREVHNYDISICLDSYVEPYDNQYYIVIRRRKDKYENISPCEQVYFDTYEEAAEAAIKYCLENLI